MKKSVCLLLLLLTILIPFLLGMASPMKMTDAREKKAVIGIEIEPSLEIHEGYVSQKEETILVKQSEKTIAKVHLSEPVMIAQADREEEWGYFQFPNIGRAKDGTLIVGWTMKEDSHLSYGQSSSRKATLMMSKDGGKTWQPQDKDYFAVRGSYKIERANGDILQVTNPSSKDITKYKNFPNPVGKNKDMLFYPMEKIPEELQGIYFYHYDAAKKKAENFQASLYDPGALRYAIEGYMPVVWWGDIKETEDGTLYAGVYPTYYLNAKKEVGQCGVSLYKSMDNGLSWTIQGKIPFEPNMNVDVRKSKNDYVGFHEPAFEILEDGTFICVMRSGSAAPMYKTISMDKGVTWSKPEPFTPNGVKPSLMLLDNGVLVLASGRPGVQLRFSFDGKGENWTEVIDMLPYMEDYKRTKDNGAATCGYASLLKADDNSFYMVYSDFKAKNKLEEERKAILFRKITIRKL